MADLTPKTPCADVGRGTDEYLVSDSRSDRENAKITVPLLYEVIPGRRQVIENGYASWRPQLPQLRFDLDLQLALGTKYRRRAQCHTLARDGRRVGGDHSSRWALREE